MRYTVSMSVKSSASGIASHTPVTPKNFGNTKRNTVITPNVRRKDMAADLKNISAILCKHFCNVLPAKQRKQKYKYRNPCYKAETNTDGLLLSMPLSILRLHAPIETADAQPPYPSQEHRGNFLLNLCSSQDRAGNPIFQDIRYPIVFTFSVLYHALCKAGISAVPAVSELENVLSDSFSFG